MKPWELPLHQKLEQRRAWNALRALPPTSVLSDFCSNDYLGLARRAFLPQGRSGATGSRLISGNSKLTEDLEAEIASFHRAEAGLLFNSGYVANLGLLSCVPQRQDTILYDELAHASIREGILLNPCRSFSFRHNDVDHLAQKMSKCTGQIFIVVESVYSMDGDEAPLAEMASLADAANAALVVDEAHATGVLGPEGRGLVCEQGLEEQVWARVHTFGKALGSHGAIVLGSALLRDYLINFCRAFIYTTGLPDVHWNRVRAAYQALFSETAHLDQLRANIRLFREGLSPEIRSHFIPSRSAIHSLIYPGNDEVKTLAETLQKAGLDVRPILHPTVPKGKERLRICVHAFNTPAEIGKLVSVLNERSGRAQPDDFSAVR